MLGPGWYTFQSEDESLTLLADVGDFLQAIGGSAPTRLLELMVFQNGSTTLAMEKLRLIRVQAGSGAGGNALVEHEYSPNGPAATMAITSLPTTDLGGTPNLNIPLQFNNLMGAHVLDVPELWVPGAIGADFAIANLGAIAHTDVGLFYKWAEYNP